MEEATVLQKVQELVVGYRSKRCVESALSGAAWGAGLGVLLAVVLKLLGARMPDLTLSLLPTLLLALLGYVSARLRPISELQLALSVDRRLGLQERFSTALDWIQSHKTQTLMYKALLKDAAAATRDLQVATLYPVRVPRALRSTAVTVPLLLLIWLLPPWNLMARTAPPLEAPALHRAAERLDLAASRLTSLPSPARNLPRTVAAQKDLRKLSRDLTSAGLTQREALARISTLADRLRQDLQKDTSDRSYWDRLSKAGLMNSPRQNPDGATSQEKGSSTLRAMARQARDADPAGQQKLKAQLRKMSREMAPGDPAQRSLAQALQQMEKGHRDKASQTLEQAAQELAQTEDKSEDSRNERQALGDLENARDSLAGTPTQEQESPGQQTASNDGSGTDSREMGDGYKNLTNEGNHVKPGKKGDNGADYGTGTTSQYQKSGKPARPKDWILNRQAQGNSHWTEAYKKLYAAERKDIAKQSVGVPGQMQQGPTLSTRTSVRGAPTVAGGATSPETNVYLDYRRKAEESISQENIPTEYRDLVRNYFDTIDPRSGTKPQAQTQ